MDTILTGLQLKGCRIEGTRLKRGRRLIFPFLDQPRASRLMLLHLGIKIEVYVIHDLELVYYPTRLCIFQEREKYVVVLS